jgi:hypothetical protein
MTTTMNMEGCGMAVVVAVGMAIAMWIAVVAVIAGPIPHTTLSRALNTRNQPTVGTSSGSSLKGKLDKTVSCSIARIAATANSCRWIVCTIATLIS